jgi:uncharacterized protein YjbI with pentapeptide repeats
MKMIESKLASVRPRVSLPGISEPLLLEDEVRSRIEARECGLVELAGPVGSGKSAALGHLAHRLGEHSFLLLADRPDEFELVSLVDSARDHFVVCASAASNFPLAANQQWRLLPWGQDEFIEYLLAVHREQCASVMRRLQADASRRWLGGVAELWQVVLDRFAADESMADVPSALRDAVYVRLPTAQSRQLARECCFARLVSAGVDTAAVELSRTRDVAPKVFSLLRHERVQTLLAAEHLAGHLRADPRPAFLSARLPEPLVRITAQWVRDELPVLDRLRLVVSGPQRASHAMAASLLHAAGVKWIPAAGRAPNLSRAYLAGVHWPGVRLRRLNLAEADLTGADLSESRLKKVCARRAQLSGANLHGALLQGFSAFEAALANADFSHVRAAQANFVSADLRGANFEGALLRRSQFENTDLRGASFRRTDLAFARFSGCQIEGADFSGADLSSARFYGAVLRAADFTGARFAGIRLYECDLESMRLPGANFEDAAIHRCYLTGSRMPSAVFRRAKLIGAGLAEIDWEGADLRDADLSYSTFHLGSSRSGLVGSPIASEGSRTGFYTDEFLDQGFKSPEEIRKANLCGADLRGAWIGNVDFYLVDLRNARYTAEQAEHFRRCGAILETRV